MAAIQPNLFDPPPPGPEGFAYQPDILTANEERALVAAFAGLDFKAFEFRGYLGARRTTSFGWRYDFGDARMHEAPPIPAFLLPSRARAAALAGEPEAAFPHVLVTEYAPGAGIGWHKDRPQFGKVVGVSLLAPCVMRFRRRVEGGFERRSATLDPRSAYLLDGPARTAWEHSITPMDQLRYSVTFRTLRS